MSLYHELIYLHRLNCGPQLQSPIYLQISQSLEFYRLSRYVFTLASRGRLQFVNAEQTTKVSSTGLRGTYLQLFTSITTPRHGLPRDFVFPISDAPICYSTAEFKL